MWVWILVEWSDFVAGIIIIGIIVGIIIGLGFLISWLLVGLFTIFFDLQIAGGVEIPLATIISIVLVVIIALFCCYCSSSD